MEIACPACGARFRLPADTSSGRALRCGACDARWMADLPPPIAHSPAQAPPTPVPLAAAPARPRRRRWPALTLALLLAAGGAAFTRAVADGDIDLTRLPYADRLSDAGIELPQPPTAATTPLVVEFDATPRDLGAAGRAVAIAGHVVNPTASRQRIGRLTAELLSPDGERLRRWPVPLSATFLEPETALAFETGSVAMPATPVDERLTLAPPRS